MSSIIAHRLHNQQITRHSFEKPGDVVAWMGAMQAQDFAGAKWAVALRLDNATDADIEQAIADKTIVRTWPLRGTLHFVAAADVRWILALTAPRMIASSARRYKELELDEPTLIRSNDLLHKALEGGKELNRKELLAMLEENGISTKGQRAAYMLQRASLDALICHGTLERNHPVYVAMDDEIPPSKRMEREDALAELAKRYFTSHGPATLQDFVWWSGLTVGDARAGLEAVKSEFLEEDFDDQTYWLPSSTLSSPDNSLYLLPGFDEYLLGYRDRSAVLDPQYAQRVVPGGNGMFMSTIVSNGRVVGLWKRTFKKGSVVMSIEPFTTLTDAELKAFAVKAERYGKYLGLPAIIS